MADTAFSGTVPRAQSYTYDLWERPSTRTDATGSWQTRYEANRGLPDSLLTPLGDSLTLTLDARGRAPSLKFAGPGGTPVQFASRGWNESGALTSLTHQVNIFSSPTWTPLAFERLDAIDSVGGALNWAWLRQDSATALVDTLRDSVTYDGWNRVTRWASYPSAGGGSVVTRDYSFDRMGNLTGAGQFYDATTNQLREAGGFLTYDNMGNLVAKVVPNWTYGYDALERLVSVRQAGVLIARYGYDVAGRRIVKRVYSASTGGTVGYLRMVYAGAQVAFETDSNNTGLSTIYTWGPGVDKLVAVQVATTAYTVVTDALGSVRALVRRSDGAWAGRLRYDPYGQLVDSVGAQPALRYRWTGREYDAETGFYFHRTRYYDPTVGRFVQEDQIGYAGGGNLYAYVDGDVLQARDTDGLEKEWVDAGGFLPGCMGGSALMADGSIVAGGCNGGGGGGGLVVYRIVVNGQFMGITVATPLLGLNTNQISGYVQDERVQFYVNRYGGVTPGLARQRQPGGAMFASAESTSKTYWALGYSDAFNFAKTPPATERLMLPDDWLIEISQSSFSQLNGVASYVGTYSMTLNGALSYDLYTFSGKGDLSNGAGGLWVRIQGTISVMPSGSGWYAGLFTGGPSGGGTPIYLGVR